MGIKIEGLKSFNKRVKKLEEKVSGTRIENEIGRELKKLVEQTFIDKISPFGRKWKQSKNNPDTLIDTGDLFNSITYKATKNKIVVSAGKGLDYAAIHNDGVGKMFKRQFIPNEGKLPKKWEKAAIDAIFNDIRKEIELLKGK